MVYYLRYTYHQHTFIELSQYNSLTQPFLRAESTEFDSTPPPRVAQVHICENHTTKTPHFGVTGSATRSRLAYGTEVRVVLLEAMTRRTINVSIGDCTNFPLLPHDLGK